MMCSGREFGVTVQYSWCSGIKVVVGWNQFVST